MTSNKERFLEMLATNQGIIFKICSTYCKDVEDQKDLVQEVIIQLWKNYHRYDDRFKITTWIYRIALNVAISFYRKTATRVKHERDFASHFLEMSSDEKTDDADNIRLLKHFINQLSDMNKALMILYLDGNSYDEIAEVLNLSVSNVGTKINRIKEKLKKRFNHLS